MKLHFTRGIKCTEVSEIIITEERTDDDMHSWIWSILFVIKDWLLMLMISDVINQMNMKKTL